MLTCVISSEVLIRVYGDPGLNSELPKRNCLVQSAKGYPARSPANGPKEYRSSATPVSHLSAHTDVLYNTHHLKQDQTNNVSELNPSLLQMVSGIALQATASKQILLSVTCPGMQTYKASSHKNYH